MATRMQEDAGVNIAAVNPWQNCFILLEKESQ